MSTRKGIILAGGTGTRLFPVTEVISKQLLPVYDKPMIYYPLTTLMLAKIREILIISTKKDINNFKLLLGDGSQWGISLKYAIQTAPNGIAESLIISEKFVGKSDIALVLGDNIFFGSSFSEKLGSECEKNDRASIFLYRVNDPENYGVVKIDKNKKPIDIIEKPKIFISNYAVTGLYFYSNEAIDIAKTLKPSKRGELEITDVNKEYLNQKKLDCNILERGFAWLDTGTHNNLLEASEFVSTIQKRQGLMIACPEEIALRMNWISIETIECRILSLENSSYGLYLKKIINELKN